MRLHQTILVYAAVAAVLSPTGSAISAEPEIVSVEKIWDRGPHNAFTGLAYWRGKFYCTFREAEAHVGGDGKLRVLASADGKAWAPIALIAEKGIDLRDPKIVVTPDDRLMIVAGGSIYNGTTKLFGYRPRVAFSKNGSDWTAPQAVLADGEWLWSVTWHDGKAYGISYSSVEMGGKRSGEWDLKLVVSDDGIKYDRITELKVTDKPNESTIQFLPDGEMIALLRRDGGNLSGLIGVSRPPYTDWKWKEIGHRLGGPNFIQLPDGSMIAASRSHASGGDKTVLARMTRDSYQPILTLPSGGDCSYPGLVWHDGFLWVSYYSSHEGKSSIYFAKVKIPLKPEKVGSRLEPFVDDYLIDRLAGGARLEVQQPEPRELVFTADKPWEGNTSGYYSIFQDGDRYRMYYRGGHYDVAAKKEAHREVTCYAESRDGVHWTRPELGLFEFDGSKRNNIVWDGPESHNFTPVLDANPACPPESKYKALGGGPPGLIAFQSADGVHWSKMSENPVITKGAFDSQNLAFWDSAAGVYREYHREFRSGARDVMTGASPDFLSWTDPVFITVGGAPRQELYTNAVRPYFRAPHILIGFPTRYLPKSQQVEPTFMASRDGLNFRRYETAVIPRTAPKDRNGNRSNYMTWGLLQLPGRDGELSVYGTEAYYEGPGSRIRRFAYRQDGFVALHAGPEGGEAVTRPIEFEGARLLLGARTAPKGSVRVEILDAEQAPLSGFSESESPTIQGDHVAAAVSWPNGNPAALAGRPVRLRFILKDADLFSFRFE